MDSFAAYAYSPIKIFGVLKHTADNEKFQQTNATAIRVCCKSIQPWETLIPNYNLKTYKAKKETNDE